MFGLSKSSGIDMLSECPHVKAGVTEEEPVKEAGKLLLEKRCVLAQYGWWQVSASCIPHTDIGSQTTGTNQTIPVTRNYCQINIQLHFPIVGGRSSESLTKAQ